MKQGHFRKTILKMLILDDSVTKNKRNESLCIRECKRQKKNRSTKNESLCINGGENSKSHSQVVVTVGV